MTGDGEDDNHHQSVHSSPVVHFLQALPSNATFVKLVESGAEWSRSDIYHDIAKYIDMDTPAMDLYTKCINSFGLKMLDSPSETGDTPFGTAIKAGNAPFVEFLMENSASRGHIKFNRLHGKVENYLHLAADKGNLRIIKAIIQYFRKNGLEDEVDRFNLDGENPFSICKTHKHLDTYGMFNIQYNDTAAEQLNVILVGISQSGKSTFIKYLHEYNDTICQAIAIGDGENSETTTCKGYPITHKYKEFFAFVGNKGKCVVKKNITQKAEDKKYQGVHLISLEKRNAKQKTDSSIFKQPNLEVHEVTYLNSARTVHLIDTPGLGDSSDAEGTDEKHVLSILDYLNNNNISKIHGVILIIKPGLRGAAIKATINYYFNLFKNNAGCIYTVFTHYDVKMRKDLARKGTDVVELRKSFLEDCGVKTNPYIYNVDLVPPSTIVDDDDREYAIEFFNGQEISKLFTNIACSGRYIRAKDIEFEKTKRILARETQLKDYIKGIRVGCESGVTQYNAAAATFLQQYNEMSADLAVKEKEFCTATEWLERHDNDQFYMLKEVIFKEPFTWYYSRPPIDFKYESDHKIHYPIEVHKWRGVTFDKVEAEKKVEIRFKSQWFQPQDAHVKIFTHNRTFYNEEIKRKEIEIKDLKYEIEKIKRSVQAFKNDHNDVSGRMNDLLDQIMKLDAVRFYFNSRVISATDFKSLLLFYNGTDCNDAMVDLVFGTGCVSKTVSPEPR
ncbi:hypothetical protein HDU80_005034 [Chytriomyces hyalinus]|nr:hypothetical protein HDU80_005034 [Chytriomyces hyalinus]